MFHRATKYLCALLLTGFGFATQAQIQPGSIDFWHSNTVWIGHGMCSATFTFDEGAFGRSIEGLEFKFNVLDREGNVIDGMTLRVDSFGRSNADRYTRAFWESENACDNSLVLVPTAASARIDGQYVDLLRSKMLGVRDFIPLKIVIE